MMMENIKCYIQCDARYNKFLLKKISDQTVIDIVINKANMISSNVTTVIYDCAENKELINHLTGRKDIITKVSNETDVTRRLLEAIEGQCDYVVKIGADQVLLDVDFTKEILQEFNGYDLFYYEGVENSVLPEIIYVEMIKRNKDIILQSDRYFRPLLNNKNIKRFNKNVGKKMLHKCRAEDFLGYLFTKHVIEDNLDVELLSRNCIRAMNHENCSIYQKGLLTSWMWGNSSNEFFYDINGDINPWWCDAAVTLVKDRIKNLHGLKVFEWGAGNSTMFFSKYADKVVSVEYDKIWADKISDIVPDNVLIKYCELEYDGDYCNMISREDALFDIILIDGRDRVRCAKNSIKKLTNNGVIIWDNTDREYYSEGYTYLKNLGFKQLELTGAFWGAAADIDSTSIFYRRDNILDI